VNQFGSQAITRAAENRIFVQTSSQISLAVRGDNIFRVLQERVLRWAFTPERNLRTIPQDAWHGNSFEIDDERSEQAEAVKLTEAGYWAFRLRERLKDPSRTWTTEVGIAQPSEKLAVFGCRLICAQRGGAAPMPRSIPRFVREIAFELPTYLDRRRIYADAWIIEAESDVDELIEFLQNPSRNHPVVLFSLPEGSDNPEETSLDVRSFIRRTAGFVHSAIVTSDASYALTDRLGRDFTVYRQAVRTFYPGFDPSNDLPTDHPVATGMRISGWGDGGGRSFHDFLVQQSLRITRPHDVLEREQPSYQHVKRIAAQTAREAAKLSGQTETALLHLMEEELRAAKGEVEASLQFAINAEAERDQMASELRQMKAGYAALQSRLNRALAATPAVVGPPLPTKLDEIENWAQMELSGQVELHRRAVKALRDSDFQDVALVRDALLMMRDFYVPMRRSGGNELRNAFNQRLATLGLQNTKCFSQENRAKNFGGDYFVSYQENSRELDWHLKGSNARDARTGFRLYYFWDDETERVIVGYLPGHLRTDIS
jgi:hypothetical protein